MAKSPEPKKQATPKARSADEMREAVAALSNDQVARNLPARHAIPPHYDAPVDILSDAIEELLELRQLRADVLTFIQVQQPKVTRRSLFTH